MINVTDDLPQTSTSSVHDKSLTNTIVDRGSVLPSICILVAIAMHVENVRCTAISHDIPEYLVAQAHLEERIVGEGVAVDSVCQGVSINMINCNSRGDMTYGSWGRSGSARHQRC
jgi:hypothetical protein